MHSRVASPSAIASQQIKPSFLHSFRPSRLLFQTKHSTNEILVKLRTKQVESLLDLITHGLITVTKVQLTHAVFQVTLMDFKKSKK